MHKGLKRGRWFTAFVAVDPERTDAGPLTEVLQPVEEPSGWIATAMPPSGARNVAYAMAAPPMPVQAMPARPMAAQPTYPAAYSAGMAPTAAGGAGQKPPTPRSLASLLKQAEKSTQVRRTGLDKVVAELMQHRDGTQQPDLRAALTQLCNSLTRFLRDPKNPTRAREVLIATDAVKRLLTPADRGSRWRFWE